MANLREAVREEKERLINQLLGHGVYKKEKKHLFELTLGELEKTYKDVVEEHKNPTVLKEKK